MNHPPELFDILAADELELVRPYVVYNPHTPTSALNIIVRRIVLSEPAIIPSHELTKLVSHKNFTPIMATQLLTKTYTHRVLANRLSSTMPFNLFAQLSESEDIYVQLALAGNKNTPVNVLLEQKIYLETESRYSMARALLCNPSTPTEVLERINELGNKYLKEDFVIHPQAPKEVVVEIWNEAVSKRKYKTISHVLQRSNIAPAVLFTKALIFHNHKFPPKKQLKYYTTPHKHNILGF